jgi:hypothetical protein
MAEMRACADDPHNSIISYLPSLLSSLSFPTHLPTYSPTYLPIYLLMLFIPTSCFLLHYSSVIDGRIGSFSWWLILSLSTYTLPIVSFPTYLPTYLLTYLPIYLPTCPTLLLFPTYFWSFYTREHALRAHFVTKFLRLEFS